MVAYSGYITRQISGLRELQNNLVDRNRKDSLQLLRIQNDLNSLALAMRDMLDNEEPYPLTAWSAQFQRLRTDLDDALRRERNLEPITTGQGRIQLSVAVGTAPNLRAREAGQGRSSGDRMAQRKNGRIQEPRNWPGL